MERKANQAKMIRVESMVQIVIQRIIEIIVLALSCAIGVHRDRGGLMTLLK